MKIAIKKSVLCAVLAASIVSCGNSEYKQASDAALKDIVLSADTDDKAKRGALKVLKKRADKGEEGAYSALIAIEQNSDAFDDEIKPYAEKALEQQYTEIINAVTNKMIYPEDLSTKDVIETLVRIELNEDGSIKNAGVSRSSGYPEFDNAATKAVFDAAPYPITDGLYDDLKLFGLEIDSNRPENAK